MTRLPATPVERAVALLILALGLLLFGVRLAGPADLTDNDQEGPTAYILDVLQNGHWLIQRDAHGAIASKPPLYTWLAALAALAGGGLTRFTLYLPCAVAVIGTALLVLRVAGRQFGVAAGLVGSFSILFSPFGIKHVVLARTDAVFMGAVMLAALAAWRAWQSGRGWTLFWLLGAAATLTKGPLGLLFASGGLLAVLWERRTARSANSLCRLAADTAGTDADCGLERAVGGERGSSATRARGSWRSVVLGLALYLALVGGWFALAYAQVGTDLTDKQLNRELVGHLSGASAGGHLPGSKLLHPLAYFLARYAPWSLLTLLGLWQVWWRPAVKGERRRFERFLACWFVAGLVILAIAPHQRADLLLPLLPAAAMLGARAVSNRLAGVSPATVARGAAALGAVLLAATPVMSRLKGEAAEVNSQTRAMEQMAAWIRHHVPAEVPLTFADNCMTLQFYLQRHQFHTRLETAAALLNSDVPVVVVTADREKLAGMLTSTVAFIEPGPSRTAAAPRSQRLGTGRGVEVLDHRHHGLLAPAAAGGPAAVRIMAPEQFKTEQVALYELAREPAAGPPRIWLLSNQPRLASWPEAAVAVGPVTAQIKSATMLGANWLDLRLEPRGESAEAVLKHGVSQPLTVGVSWRLEEAERLYRFPLRAGESARSRPTELVASEDAR